MWTISPSEQDQSVNHIWPTPDRGAFEARWVQRSNDYGIVYVSSHTGCALSCRFCHLTATGQTMMTPATLDDYVGQVRQALTTYQERQTQGLPSIDRLHINFMARGEPLDNPTVLTRSGEMFSSMRRVADQMMIPQTHFLVSSILPKNLNRPLDEVLSDPHAYLYYSLYSMSPAFRKRWLPKALPGEVGLDLCQEYQKVTGKRITLHGTFIKGENDSDADVDALIDAVSARNLWVKFNLVRYNPYDHRHGVETDEVRLHEIFRKLQAAFGDQDSRIVPRVGFDVKASCGMFIERDV